MSTCIAPHATPGARCPEPREPGSLFCRRHEQAPAARRGGWLSAELRRRKRAGGEAPIDISAIVNRLWIGGRPPFDRDLPDFDVLVLAAGELQPERTAFHGAVLRCPIPDGVLTTHELGRAAIVARTVAEAIANGRRSLVTSSAGMNRCAFIAALALQHLTGMSADAIVSLIRSRRHHLALNNQYFVTVVQAIAGSGRSGRPRA